MEAAGNADFDKNTERKGIGTPATRAGIIEKLITCGYAIRRGKQLLPTQDGTMLIQVLPEYLKSPSMTAEWENELLEMEQGKVPVQQFMDEITLLTQKIIEECSKLPEEEKERFLNRRKIGICPACGLDENGDPEIEEVEATVQKYKVTNVFDISQTEGDPIETLDAAELTAGVENYAEFLQAVEKVAPVPIRFDELTGQTKGYFHTVKQEIVIQKGMAESQTLKTAIHETAHSLLHNKEKMAEQEDLKNRQTKEVEAESVAFVVCSAFGLDTSEYSFPYIAGWSSGKEMTELKASMDVIRKTSSNLIKSIEKEVQHLLTEKEKQKFLDAHANDTISFYVADDMDYPISGDFWEYQTLEEAWDFYQKHLGDAVHGLRGIGFQIQDGSDYIGMEPLIKDGMVQIDEINHKPYYRDHPLVQKAISDLQDLMRMNQNRTKPDQPLEKAEKQIKSKGRAQVL